MAGSDSPPSGALPGLPGVQTPRALQMVPFDQTPTPKSSSGLEFELGRSVANMLRERGSDTPRSTSRTLTPKQKPTEKSHLFQDVNDTQKQVFLRSTPHTQKHHLTLPITPRNRTILEPMPLPLHDCATPMRSMRNECTGTPRSVLKNQGTPMSASSMLASQRTPVGFDDLNQSKGEPDDSDDAGAGSVEVDLEQERGDSDQVAKSSRTKKRLENPTAEVECVPQGMLT